MKTMGLMAFLRGNNNGVPGCCNFDNGNCIFDGPCLVREGKRCAWFEGAVLPTAIENGVGESIYKQYEEQVQEKALFEETKNVCADCGTWVEGRNKRCADCKKKHRRRRQKEYYRKNRS